MIIALNGLFILEPYQQGQGIRTEVRAGLALPGQKLNLVPLKLKADTKVDGQLFKAGSIAYIPEDILMTSQWAKLTRKAPDIDGEFILVESRYVSAVKPRED
jgi:hypothetical protein